VPQVIIRRTERGWRIDDVTRSNDGADGPDLTTDHLLDAIVLADLLADDLGQPARPERTRPAVDDLDALRQTIAQLEHALSTRVVIERALGVLAERWRCPPQEAFERLRRLARTEGTRVHDLAVAVVASVTDPGVPLPVDLPPNRA